MQQKQQPDGLLQAIDEHMVEQSGSAQQTQKGEDDLTITSRGEYILPFFIAGMEASWLDAALIGLAGLDFLHSSSPLLPFWGPPLLLIVTLLLFRRAAQKEAEAEDAGKTISGNLLAMPGLRLMFGVLAVLTLLLIWLHLYAATYSLFDPGWILAFGGDILALGSNLFAMVVIIGVAVYCTWRGMKLAQLEIKSKNLFRHIWAPEQIFRQIWIGLLVFLVAILVRAHLGNGGTDDVILVLLVPIFLYCSLSAHALARIVMIRNEHPFGLEGSIAAQERSLLSVVGGVGVALGLLTVIGGVAFSSTFFTSLQPMWGAIGTAYDWFSSALAQVITWILMPLFAFFSAWLQQGSRQLKPQQQPTVHGLKNLPDMKAHNAPPVAVVTAIEILIPVLIFLGLGLTLWLVLRNRKRLRISLNRKTGDVHESIWSWQLFWSQFKAFWLGIFRRLFPVHAASTEAEVPEEIIASPAARTIREIYRALLKKAAQRGHTRKRDETPYEFRHRLNAHEANNEPQLGMLTDAYALTRYGGSAPNEHELNIVRQLWSELEQKWNA